MDHLEHLVKYNAQSRGFGHNVGLLHERLQSYADHIHRSYKKGGLALSFVLGLDFKPQMSYEDTMDVRKEGFFAREDIWKKYEKEHKNLMTLQDLIRKIGTRDEDMDGVEDAVKRL